MSCKNCFGNQQPYWKENDMTGWNLPPGCNVSDIPGNRPDELEAEAVYDKLCEELEKHQLLTIQTEDEFEKLVLYIMRKMGEAYGEGYQKGMADEAFAHDQIKTEKLAREYFANKD